MRIEFLGTGGATTIPIPGCNCRVCTIARKKGLPYTRMGPSIFIHDENILFDTPEEINYQLSRAGITTINACFYSHWHPDHVMGRRIFETMNFDWRGLPPKHKFSNVYLPEQVAIDFKTRLGMYEHLEFFKKHGIINLVEMKDGQTVELHKTKITPFRLSENYVYAFLIEESKKRIIIAMDELFGWQPPDSLRNVDLAILPMGFIDINPITNERNVDPMHPLFKSEATFSQTIDIVKKLSPKNSILTHIEESDALSYDELKEIEDRLNKKNVKVTFAYDTMKIEL
jgi:phosphoribosyl 1,2-cyclic phosphate phosphodiesterase